MVLVLMGLLDEINDAKRMSDLAARLSTAGGAARSGSKRPNASTGYVHDTWHGTAKSTTSAPGTGVHPLLKSNLKDSGCPQTAPQYARGANYVQRQDRTQAAAPYQTGQAGQAMYNPFNPQMARLQMAHGSMGYQQGYLQPAPAMYQPQMQPIQPQGQPVQQQQLMQQPVYTPPQAFVHPDNTKPAQQPASTTANRLSTLIPTPVETPAPGQTQPVSTGTVETPPEVEPVPGSGGFFWTFSSLILLGSIAAIIWYYYQKVYGKRHSRRAPRRWETIRAKVMQNHYVQDRLRSNGDLEGGYPGRVGRQHSVDNQVPLCSRHPSLLERVSKGSKLG